MDPRDRTPPGADDVDIGAGIDDVRAHLRHAHGLGDDSVLGMGSADLHAIHRRLHGRAVTPDPALVDVGLLELRTDPDRTCTTTWSLEDARTDPDLVWLPLRVADLVHRDGAPGHVRRGGCRACADVVAGAVEAIAALDRTPHQELARALEALATSGHEVARLRAAIVDACRRLEAADPTAGVLSPVDGGPADADPIEEDPVERLTALVDAALSRAQPTEQDPLAS